MPRTSGKKTDAKSKEVEAKKEQEAPQTYQYTSVRIQNKSLRKNAEGQWNLNVNVPTDVSPTNWANINLPTGKTAADSKKSLWFKTAHKNQDGTESDKVSDLYIANEIKELKGVSTGKAGADGVGKEFEITPSELRQAIIKQDASNKAAQKPEAAREVPEVAAAEDEVQAQAGA